MGKRREKIIRKRIEIEEIQQIITEEMAKERKLWFDGWRIATDVIFEIKFKIRYSRRKTLCSVKKIVIRPKRKETEIEGINKLWRRVNFSLMAKVHRWSWSRDVSAGFIAEDIQGIVIEFDKSLTLKFLDGTRNVFLGELNVRETEELLKYVESQK